MFQNSKKLLMASPTSDILSKMLYSLPFLSQDYRLDLIIRNCFNCGLPHNGGERMCKKPCKICGDKKHTRYGCPKRKAKLSSKKPSGDGKDMKNAGQGGRQINNSGQGGGQGHACFEIPHISDISDDKNNKAFVAKNSTSLLNPLPDNCNQDGPGGPILDSGATSTYAGVTRAPGGSFQLSNSCDVPKNLIPHSGTVSVGNGAKLPILARCSLWGIRNVQLVEGLTQDLIDGTIGKCVVATCAR